MNTNMTGFRWFSIFLHPCAMDEISLSIGGIKEITGKGIRFKVLVLYPPKCSHDLPSLVGLYTRKPFQSPGRYSTATGSI